MGKGVRLLEDHFVYVGCVRYEEVREDEVGEELGYTWKERNTKLVLGVS